MMKIITTEQARRVVRMTKQELEARLHRLQHPDLRSRQPESREHEFQAVLQELEVHQIELEMQNQELRDSRMIIEEAHERYIDLYDFAPLGYVTLTPQGVMKEVNLTAAHMIGIERQWLIGRVLSQWIFPEDQDHFRGHLSQCQSTLNTRVNTRVRLAGRNKALTLVELSTLKIYDPIQGVDSYRTAISDLTDRNEIEKALKRAVTDLSEEKALREKFVSTLTHDLKTPLTSAKLMVELMVLQDKTQGLVGKPVKKLLRNLDRIENMVDDLLDADRVRAGEKIPVKMARFDILSLIRRTLKELSEIHGNKIQYENLTRKKVIFVSWSKSGIRRILENLVNNAAKYGDKNQKIRVQSYLESPQVFRISVHNEGPPIPPEEQRHLFYQFQRGKTARQGTEKGWGLGLTLVKAMLDAHDGQITVQSAPNSGTTFFVQLPIQSDVPLQISFPEISEIQELNGSNDKGGSLWKIKNLKK